ncbi:NAD(+)--dinitrogen-reductase ADP-D-ribosyltransferase [Vibrio sp. RC27]
MVDTDFPVSAEYLLSRNETDILRSIVTSLNHCNVPSLLLASLVYQRYPIPIEIDGISAWYSKFFASLADVPEAEVRAHNFKQFMTHRFNLSKERYQSDELRDDPPPRPKVNYRRLLLGWLFDSDNEQGAAWRSWVESRFGLVTCFHQQALPDPDSSEYMRYRNQCTKAIYNTNTLYDQLDLLYCFCQQELRLRYPNCEHITLYRGSYELPNYCINGKDIILFNNLSSFSLDVESALRFGSKIYQVEVPLSKIACFESLLPKSLEGEQEFMVLGGLYVVERLKI